MAPHYRIVLDCNGGTDDYYRYGMPEGSSFYSLGISLHVPVREGYEFLGWYTEPALENLFDIKQPIEKNWILYAGWREITESTESDIEDPVDTY